MTSDFTATGAEVRARPARMRTNCARLSTSALLLLFLGCASDRVGETSRTALQSLGLRTLDSVDLKERGGVFVSKPNDILITKDGRILVSDAATGSVLAYSPTGDFLNAISIPGTIVLGLNAGIALQWVFTRRRPWWRGEPTDEPDLVDRKFGRRLATVLAIDGLVAVLLLTGVLTR